MRALHLVAWMCVGCTGLDPIILPDAGTTDGGDESTLFACGVSTCDSQTQYCRANGNQPEAGPDNCQTYPGKCTQDGGAPTCACIESCTCTQDGLAITVTCP